jgi:hypothetical protein
MVKWEADGANGMGAAGRPAFGLVSKQNWLTGWLGSAPQRSLLEFEFVSKTAIEP